MKIAMLVFFAGSLCAMEPNNKRFIPSLSTAPEDPAESARSIKTIMDEIERRNSAREERAADSPDHQEMPAVTRSSPASSLVHVVTVEDTSSDSLPHTPHSHRAVVINIENQSAPALPQEQPSNCCCGASQRVKIALIAGGTALAASCITTGVTLAIALTNCGK